jgi:hypothetical protein
VVGLARLGTSASTNGAEAGKGTGTDETWEGKTMNTAAGIGGGPFTILDLAAKTLLTGTGDAGSADAGSDGRYWPRPDRSRTVSIKNDWMGFFDFVFTPTSPEGDKGTVQGLKSAFKHSGNYTITANSSSSFEIAVNIGEKPAHRDDMNVKLRIVDGAASLTGTTGEDEKALPAGVKAPVKGNGSSSQPFLIEFGAASLQWTRTVQ